MKTVIIVGGGKSISEGITKDIWARICSYDVWSLNFAYKFIPFLPTRQVWVDYSFFRVRIEELEALSKQGVLMHTKEHPKYHEIKNINQHGTITSRQEVPQNTNKLFRGRLGLCGIFALSLALKENYNVIYLLGYDFGTSTIKDKETHFYQDEIKKYDIISSGVNRPIVYRNKEDKVKTDVLDFEEFRKAKAKIYNVSIESNITTFEKISYDQFFDKLRNLNNANKETA